MSVLALTACGDDDDDDGAGAADAMVADASADAAPACNPGDGRTVFLNRGGGVYDNDGPDDASANKTRLVAGETTVQAFTGDPVWDDLVACVAGKFAPFAVTITDVDPGAALHREVVFTASPEDIGALSNTTGLAPFDCPTAENPEPMAIGIAFVFPGSLAGDASATCQVTAQMIGNMFNLDHALYCKDVMTFLEGCGDKSFVDMDVPCGEVEQRACACGGATQNSYQTIAGIAGANCD